MPVICQTYGIKPWEYYDRLAYRDWKALRSHIDQMNDRSR
jgi:hypothetical protein